MSDRRLIIKVCGITQYEQLMQLSESDADLIGHIYYARSPRNLDSFQLTRVFTAAVQKPQVLVTVDHDLDQLLELIRRFNIPYVQLHGKESPEYCKRVADHTRLIKAVSIRSVKDFDLCIPLMDIVDYFLFDTKSEDKIGGTGLQWDWSLLKYYTLNTPFFISGGIRPDHVDKIKSLRYPNLVGVDINSRFESKPGVKRMEEVHAFIKNLRNE